MIQYVTALTEFYAALSRKEITEGTRGFPEISQHFVSLGCLFCLPRRVIEAYLRERGLDGKAG